MDSLQPGEPALAGDTPIHARLASISVRSLVPNARSRAVEIFTPSKTAAMIALPRLPANAKRWGFRRQIAKVGPAVRNCSANQGGYAAVPISSASMAGGAAMAGSWTLT